jgi:hypothetical protein
VGKPTLSVWAAKYPIVGFRILTRFVPQPKVEGRVSVELNRCSQFPIIRRQMERTTFNSRLRDHFPQADLIGIGAAVTRRPLPHHRAYGSVHGGSSWLR